MRNFFRRVAAIGFIIVLLMGNYFLILQFGSNPFPAWSQFLVNVGVALICVGALGIGVDKVLARFRSSG